VTDCLNFGNPQKREVAWQLTEAVAGLAEACSELHIPIVSGNVSLYNETSGQAIPPTASVGMVGLLPDVSLAVPTGFRAGCEVVLLGEPPRDLGASEYLPDLDAFPWFDLEDERRLGGLLCDLAARRLLSSAQDVADGGLAVALAECALLGNCGVRIEALDGPSLEVALFSEDQGRAVVTCRPGDVPAILSLAAERAVPAVRIGSTGGDRLTVHAEIDVDLDRLRTTWDPPA
jgi:phosphoribosylformylglycinamidine synthase